MNFFTRNLGWILLFAFFIFMLVIISSNSDEDAISNSGSTVTNTSTGEANLEKLSQKIENETGAISESLEKDELSASGEVISSSGELSTDTKDTVDTPTKDADLSFFERLFGKKETKPVENNQTGTGTDAQDSASGSVDSSDEVVTNTGTSQAGSTSSTPNQVQTLRGEDLSKAPSASNLTSTTNKTPWKTTQDHTINYPGTSLKTFVGKQFKVGVHSLRLNNVYFNETLAFMFEGDRVEQLTPENSYGCFKIKIISSSTTQNNGSMGYVCKKYLKDTTGGNVNTPVQKEIKKNVQSEQKVQEEVKYSGMQTQIGDIIMVNVDNVSFDNGEIKLQKGDSVDQMTKLDSAGCFIGRVFTAKIASSLEQVAKMCMSELR
ncbi:hypothetical protein GW846_01700 [Candidatus Gracilibacteria bacterium]|nr:hypothetical protein [Candidatus Gracilibacteria bacterium]